MGLYNTVTLRDDLPKSFRWDWLKFKFDEEMIEKYRHSVVGVTEGQIRNRNVYFCKNASIFDMVGRKIAWGDVAPADVLEMQGVYYLLSEHKSFFKVPKKAVQRQAHRREDPNSVSRYQHLLPSFEPVLLRPSYVRGNAIARILDGQIQTSRELITRHY